MVTSRLLFILYVTCCLGAYQHDASFLLDNHQYFKGDPRTSIIGFMDEQKSMAEFVLSKGYPLEEHLVVTEDGFILTVFRVPHGRIQPTAPEVKRPVILQHGLFSTSTCYVLSSPEKGLGFILADEGFDVWLPNSRGNTYSRKHIHLDPDTNAAQFFNYSFHEMGYYDLPAVIDFVLAATTQDKITYVGHSQGTTELLTLLATRPEYNEKIRTAELMAPVAFLDGTKGTVFILAAFNGFLSRIARLLGIHEVLTNSYWIHFFDKTMCEKTVPTKALCENFLFALSGFDPQQFNMSLVPLIADQGPSGASVKQLEHFGQLSNNGGKFAMFDYGHNGNMLEYGQRTPPDYDLANVYVQVHLHYGMNDWIVGVEDVLKLSRKLVNFKLLPVPYAKFMHLDFLWAKDVNTLLYNRMVSLMKDEARNSDL